MSMTRDFSTGVTREPIVIGVQHALFRRHAQRIFDQAEQAEHGLDRRYAVQRRIEFGTFAELELVDHLAGKVARQDDLRLAGHRLLIDGVAVAGVLVGIRPQIDVVASLDKDPRLREISRRDHLDREQRRQRDQNRRAQDFPFFAPQAPRRAPADPIRRRTSISVRGGGDATLIGKLLATNLPTDRKAMADHKLLRLLSG